MGETRLNSPIMTILGILVLGMTFLSLAGDTVFARTVTLTTSEPVVEVPQGLVFTEDASGTTHTIPLSGPVPGTSFTGTFPEIAVGICGTFSLPAGAMVDAAGNAGNEITSGDSYCVAAPAPTPTPTQPPYQAEIALYDLNEGSGTTAADSSSYGVSLPLQFTGTTGVTWLVPASGVEFSGGTMRSSEYGSKICNAIGGSNRFTIEAWVQPANLTQAGPARMVTMSAGTPLDSRNFTLAQSGTDLVMRLRTGASVRDDYFPVGLTLGVHHIVVTHDGATERVYVDGSEAGALTFPAGFSTWDPNYHLLLGNEFTEDRPWHGRIYRVAIFERSLSSADVAARFAAGYGSTEPPATWTDTPTVLPTDTPLPTNTPQATNTPGPTDTATPTVPPYQEEIALYPLDEGTGGTAADTSLYSPPLPLQAYTAGVAWAVPGPGLEFSGAIVRSTELGVKICNTIKATSRFSFEVWIEPADLIQTGPARIVSMSTGTAMEDRNFTLGQSGTDLVMRVRTGGAVREDFFPVGLTLGAHHIVVTHDGNVERVYVDAGEAGSRSFPAEFSGWDPNCYFYIGNEASGNRPWHGIIRRAAVFCRALDAAEVADRYAAGYGAEPTATPPPVEPDTPTPTSTVQPTDTVRPTDTPGPTDPPATATPTYSGDLITAVFGDAAGSDYPGTCEDTFLNTGSYANTNYSADPVQLNTYTWPKDSIANTISMKWDLSALAPNAAVTSARLELFLNKVGGDPQYTVSVHRIIGKDPVIQKATWNSYDGVNPWTDRIGGGLADIGEAEDVVTLPATVGAYYSWNVTAMVQGWVNDPAQNRGLLLISDPTAGKDSYRYFLPTDNPDPSRRPRLVVKYSLTATGPTSTPTRTPTPTATEPPPTATPTPQGDRYTLNLSTNADAPWALFSLPLTPDSTIDEFLAGVAPPGTLYRYDTANQMLAEYGSDPGFGDRFQVGTGYVLVSEVPMNLTVYGTGTDAANPFSIPLHQGWNLIGYPFILPVSWPGCRIEYNGESVSVNEAGLRGWIQPSVWRFVEGDYFFAMPDGPPTDVLEPGLAYYIHAHTACTLVIPAPAAKPSGIVLSEPVAGEDAQ